MECPVCKLDQNVYEAHNGDRHEIQCNRCGRFAITGTAFAMAAAGDKDLKLSAWLRSRQRSSEIPLINSQTPQQVKSGHPEYRVSQKQTLFLQALQDRTTFPGEHVLITRELDFTLAWCSSAQELDYIIRALMARSLIELAGWEDPSDSFAVHLTITPKGWDYLDEAAKTSVLSRQAFVAMSFAPELQSAWTVGIQPALNKAGYQPYRVDSSPHIERIDAKIMAEIRSSRLMIADVTQQRPGVYYEAGFAAGLGIPVFWAVRHDDLPNIHFDTRQYYHIVWKTEAELLDKLYDSVVGVMGKAS
jgi:nucleoside 2-deoxyribosyltransferase